MTFSLFNEKVNRHLFRIIICIWPTPRILIVWAVRIYVVSLPSRLPLLLLWQVLVASSFIVPAVSSVCLTVLPETHCIEVRTITITLGCAVLFVIAWWTSYDYANSALSFVCRPANSIVITDPCPLSTTCSRTEQGKELLRWEPLWLRRAVLCYRACELLRRTVYLLSFVLYVHRPFLPFYSILNYNRSPSTLQELPYSEDLLLHHLTYYWLTLWSVSKVSVTHTYMLARAQYKH